MKKLIGLSIITLSLNVSFSQDDALKNKNGVDIMPVQGEFSIGMDASPFLRYVGDIFGYNSSNSALGGNKFISDYFGSNTIYGKYMLTDDNAIRANFRLTDQKYTYKYNVFNDGVNSPDSLVEDRRVYENSQFNIGLGYEFRRGNTRLKGIYGGEVVFMRSQNKTRYEYANQFGMSNMSPTSMYDENGSFQGGHGDNVAERRISYDQSRTLGIGLRAFVGVEYYFAPKICLGAEFGQALSYTASSESTIISEYFDATATDSEGNIGAVRQRETITAGNKYFGLNTDNFNGSLYLMFYF